MFINKNNSSKNEKLAATIVLHHATNPLQVTRGHPIKRLVTFSTLVANSGNIH